MRLRYLFWQIKWKYIRNKYDIFGFKWLAKSVAKNSLIVSRDTLYMRRGNVRFPFITSSLPGGNGREIDRIDSHAEKHYEKLFWRIAEFKRPPPWNQFRSATHLSILSYLIDKRYMIIVSKYRVSSWWLVETISCYFCLSRISRW